MDTFTASASDRCTKQPRPTFTQKLPLRLLLRSRLLAFFTFTLDLLTYGSEALKTSRHGETEVWQLSRIFRNKPKQHSLPPSVAHTSFLSRLAENPPKPPEPRARKQAAARYQNVKAEPKESNNRAAHRLIVLRFVINTAERPPASLCNCALRVWSCLATRKPVQNAVGLRQLEAFPIGLYPVLWDEPTTLKRPGLLHFLHQRGMLVGILLSSLPGSGLGCGASMLTIEASAVCSHICMNTCQGQHDPKLPNPSACTILWAYPGYCRCGDCNAAL